MRVIITGASGMIGRGVLLECLDHADISAVLIIVRSKLEIEHPKLTQIIHSDFGDYSAIHSELIGYDAVYLCMGISAAGLSEDAYRKITYDYTLALAQTLYKINPKMTCTYVSGVGTDSSGKGRVMWARVKGKTENDLLALGFDQAFMFRPGMIIPLRGIRSRTKMYQFVYDYLMWLVLLVKKLAPNSVVNTTQIGQAMINVTRSGYKHNILEPADILEAADMK